MKRKLISIIIFLSIGLTLHAYNYGTLEGNAKGCEEGYAKACNDLAGMYLSGESKYNLREDKTKAKELYDRSISLYKKYCAEGEAKACFDLGDKYNGMRWGIDQNLTMMMKYYTKSCALGYSFGCNELGAAYKRGNGVNKDSAKSKMFYEKAIVLYEKECENNIAESCDRLGTIFVLEMYGTHDREKGLELEKKAFRLYMDLCEQGNAEGCFQVASSYYTGGKVVKVDWTKAKAYYKKSCDFGESSACWREKDINPNEQIKYEKKMELAQLNFQYLAKRKEEEDKWNARLAQQQEELLNSNLARAEQEELLKKMESENISWKKESEKRLEKAKKVFEEKKKEIEPWLH